MRVKKSSGKVFGATMSSTEKKALDMEIRRQVAEYDRNNAREIDAIVLWVLHTHFGFGPKRLKQFYDNFCSSVNDLLKRYEMDESDRLWLFTYKLKEAGVDLEQWEKEKSNE